MKIAISEEKLKSLYEKLINNELDLYKKELNKKDFSDIGLELFDEVAKKNISSIEKIEVDDVKLGKDVIKGRLTKRFNAKEIIIKYNESVFRETRTKFFKGVSKQHFKTIVWELQRRLTIKTGMIFELFSVKIEKL